MLLSLVGIAYGFLWSYIPPVVVAFGFLVLLSLMAGYKLLSENDGLKEGRVDVKICYEKRPPFYSRDDAWYRIGVHNTSPTVQAERVDVKLESIEPLPAGLSDVVLPCRLGRKDAPDPRGEIVHINPGATEPFDVVTDRGDTVYFLTVIQTGPIALEIGREYRMKISAKVGNPKGGGSHDETMFLLRHPTGKQGDLEFTPPAESTPDAASPQATATP